VEREFLPLPNPLQLRGEGVFVGLTFSQVCSQFIGVNIISSI